jgi:predicted transcriptional regulator
LNYTFRQRRKVTRRRIIRELIEFEPKSRKTDIAQALKFLSSTQKKKAIVFVISDFMSEDYEHTLKIASKT